MLERQHLRQHPTAFMAPELGRCFVRSTTGTSGIVGQIVKPHESLAERAAIERRWFDSLGLGRVFQLAMVTEWSDVRPWHSLRFHDWRIRYTGMSLDDALSRLKRGERLADLVVSTPLVAQRLRDVDTSPRTTYASSFEFSSFTHARLLGYESGEFECSSETYVAGELTAPVAFRFPGCDFFHVNSDAVVVEIVDASGANVEPGLAGRIIVTDLLNDAMPLVRYDIGDFGAVVDRECCGCGRVTPRLNLLGREFHPRYDEGRWLLETLRARCDRFVLVEAARGNFVILSTDDQRELLRDASRRNLEVRATSQVPRALDGLARARSALSLAERPLPPSEASRT